jgi:hypothetical protein
VTAARPRPSSRARLRGALLGALALLAAGCASAPSARPPAPEADTARGLLEARWRSFVDLRTLADVTIRRGGRTQRLSGPLLLRAPSSMRFEALSAFGPPVLVVAGSPESVTVWEVLRNRAYLLPSSPDANRRWLGLALGTEDLVGILSAHLRPLPDARETVLHPPDQVGPSLELRGAGVTQRIWFDPATGAPRKLDWQAARPFQAEFTVADGVPTAIALLAPAQELDVRARYQRPQLNAGLDADSLRVAVPQSVEIQDFR